VIWLSLAYVSLPRCPSLLLYCSTPALSVLRDCCDGMRSGGHVLSDAIHRSVHRASLSLRSCIRAYFVVYLNRSTFLSVLTPPTINHPILCR